MNRRDLLKLVGVSVVVPGSVLMATPKCEHEFRWFAVKNKDAPKWVLVYQWQNYHHYEYKCKLCGAIRISEKAG